MKGFLQEYGIMMVVVSVVLGMLTFGKTGYAKNIQNAILGSADHIVETGQNIAKKNIDVKSGDTLDIEGTKYVVLEQQENNQALIMTASSIGNREFQPLNRTDRLPINTYEGSNTDGYLEKIWYKKLSAKMQSAILTTSIKQTSYSNDGEQETGYNGQVYNTISRHVFLPSISEIGKAVDLKNSNKVKAFLNDTSIWTRNSCQGYANIVMCLTSGDGGLFNPTVKYKYGVRPAFVIDLSQVDYKVAGHTDYK